MAICKGCWLALLVGLCLEGVKCQTKLCADGGKFSFDAQNDTTPEGCIPYMPVMFGSCCDLSTDPKDTKSTWKNVSSNEGNEAEIILAYAVGVKTAITCSGNCPCPSLTGTESSVSISSGPGNYANNSMCTWTITSATQISLSFSSFDIEAGDYVAIKSCTSSSSSSCSWLSNLQDPGLTGALGVAPGPGLTQEFTVEAGFHMQVVFSTDGKQLEGKQGFAANVSFTTPLQKTSGWNLWLQFPSTIQPTGQQIRFKTEVLAEIDASGSWVQMNEFVGKLTTENIENRLFEAPFIRKGLEGFANCTDSTGASIPCNCWGRANCTSSIGNGSSWGMVIKGNATAGLLRIRLSGLRYARMGVNIPNSYGLFKFAEKTLIISTWNGFRNESVPAAADYQLMIDPWARYKGSRWMMFMPEHMQLGVSSLYPTGVDYFQMQPSRENPLIKVKRWRVLDSRGKFGIASEKRLWSDRSSTLPWNQRSYSFMQINFTINGPWNLGESAYFQLGDDAGSRFISCAKGYTMAGVSQLTANIPAVMLLNDWAIGLDQIVSICRPENLFDVYAQSDDNAFPVLLQKQICSSAGYLVLINEAKSTNGTILGPSFTTVPDRAKLPITTNPPKFLPTVSGQEWTGRKGYVNFDVETRLNGGPRTLKFATNGGLTIVTVMRFKNQNQRMNESVIHFNNDNTYAAMILKRCGNAEFGGVPVGTGLAFEIRSPPNLKPISGCTGDGIFTMPSNDWMTVVVRYRASTREYWLSVNDKDVLSGTASAALPDMMFSNTWLGIGNTSDAALNITGIETTLSADIAGFFVVDEYMEKRSTNALADAMYEGLDLSDPSTIITLRTGTASGLKSMNLTAPVCQVNATCNRFFALVLTNTTNGTTTLPSFTDVQKVPVKSSSLPTYVRLGGPNGNGHVTFDRTKSQFLNAGRRTLNIATNGGMTFVAVMRFTGTAGKNERLFEFGSVSGLYNIGFGRKEETNKLSFTASNGADPLILNFDETIDELPQDTWITVTLSYCGGVFCPTGAAQKVRSRFTCMKPDIGFVSAERISGQISPLADRTVSDTYMGRGLNSPASSYFNGDIAGFFVVDEYMHESTTAAIADAMIRGVDLTDQSGSFVSLAVGAKDLSSASNTTVARARGSLDNAEIRDDAVGGFKLTYVRKGDPVSSQTRGYVSDNDVLNNELRFPSIGVVIQRVGTPLLWSGVEAIQTPTTVTFQLSPESFACLLPEDGLNPDEQNVDPISGKSISFRNGNQSSNTNYQNQTSYPQGLAGAMSLSNFKVRKLSANDLSSRFFPSLAKFLLYSVESLVDLRQPVYKFSCLAKNVRAVDAGLCTGQHKIKMCAVKHGDLDGAVRAYNFANARGYQHLNITPPETIRLGPTAAVLSASTPLSTTNSKTDWALTMKNRCDLVQKGACNVLSNNNMLLFYNKNTSSFSEKNNQTYGSVIQRPDLMGDFATAQLCCEHSPAFHSYTDSFSDSFTSSAGLGNMATCISDIDCDEVPAGVDSLVVDKPTGQMAAVSGSESGKEFGICCEYCEMFYGAVGCADAQGIVPGIVDGTGTSDQNPATFVPLVRNYCRQTLRCVNSDGPCKGYRMYATGTVVPKKFSRRQAGKLSVRTGQGDGIEISPGDLDPTTAGKSFTITHIPDPPRLPPGMSFAGEALVLGPPGVNFINPVPLKFGLLTSANPNTQRRQALGDLVNPVPPPAATYDFPNDGVKPQEVILKFVAGINPNNGDPSPSWIPVTATAKTTTLNGTANPPSQQKAILCIISGSEGLYAPVSTFQYPNMPGGTKVGPYPQMYSSAGKEIYIGFSAFFCVLMLMWYIVYIPAWRREQETVVPPKKEFAVEEVKRVPPPALPLARPMYVQAEPVRFHHGTPIKHFGPTFDEIFKDDKDWWEKEQEKGEYNFPKLPFDPKADAQLGHAAGVRG